MLGFARTRRFSASSAPSKEKPEMSSHTAIERAPRRGSGAGVPFVEFGPLAHTSVYVPVQISLIYFTMEKPCGHIRAVLCVEMRIM